MDDDDDDYMSDKILNQCLESDIRPGLLYSNKQRRAHNLYKKKQETARPFKEVADERRNEGLKTAIPETNKGFELLKKMGYKPGSGVGKSEAGPNKPIDLELKEDKTGLGHKTERKEKQKMLKQTSFSAYRTAMKKRKELSDLKYDYGRIRRACQYFDEKDDLKGPIKKWFWPDAAYSKGEDKRIKKEDVSDTDSEMHSDNDSDEEWKKPLELLTAEELDWRIEHIVIYLREKYNYCIWCGFKFDDEKDLLEVCPGRTRYEHEGTTRHVESDHE